LLVLIILTAVLFFGLFYILPRKHFKSLLWNLIIIGIWSVTWLLLFQYELILTGSTTGTYGSDATYYYEAMHAGYFSNNPSQVISAYYNQLYIWFGIILLKTSPFFSIIWVKLGNIVLLLYIISMIYLVLYRAGVPRRIITFVCLFAGLNGIVTWMCIRNLKDTLFLFLLVGNCFLATNYYFSFKKWKRNKKIIYLFILLAISAVLPTILRDIRQWAYIIPWLILICLLLKILMDNKSFKRLFPILGIGAVFLLPIIVPAMIGTDVIINFKSYASTIGLGARTGLSLVSGIFVGFLRFIIGPGPFRAMMGNDIFLVTTNIGNMLIFLGSLMWWLVLPLMVLRMRELFGITIKEIIIVAPFLLYVFIYIYVYQGSVETRFRAVLYIISMLLWGLTYAYYKPLKHRANNSQLAYIVCALLVFLSGTIATFLTLS
jgi:hypothetical protein